MARRKRKAPKGLPVVRLTEKQLQAARLYARGKTIGEVAEALGVSEPTAKQHLARVRVLTGVSRSRDIHEKLELLEEFGHLEVV